MTTLHVTIPDGIPDYKYVINGKANPNLSRKAKGILVILTGIFQNLEKR